MKTLEGGIDKTICGVFDKTGCCPQEEGCTKMHRQPEISRCLVFHHIYPDPELFINSLPDPKIIQIPKEQQQNLFNAFYMDMVSLLAQFGPLEDLVIASNKSDTLSGNALAMFREVDGAYAAYMALNGEYYCGRKIHITFSPTLRLTSAICRVDECKLGLKCHFIHPFNPSPDVYSDCFSRSTRQFPTPQREYKKRQYFNSPQDLLYGKIKKKDKRNKE